jgi:tetratricopeptide (TPR) repeat protein
VVLSDPRRLEQARHAVNRANQCLEENRPEDAQRILEEALAAEAWTGDVHNILTHNLTGALRLIAVARLGRGERDSAARAAALALDVPPPQRAAPEMLRNRAEFFHSLGLSFFQAGMFAEALPCQRRAIALYPCPSFQNNLINTIACLRAPSVLADYCDTMEPKDIAPHLLIACQPKSGSTFLKNVLCEVTGFRDLYLFHASGQSEQDLFYPLLLEFATVPSVTQQHCRAAEANLQMMQAFGMRAVVLVRNLADVIVSLRDFYAQGAILGTFIHPDVWTPLSPERQIDLIIDHVVPWHLQFLASWQQADRERRVPVMWLTYEELMRDQCSAVQRVLAFHNMGVPDGKVAAALASLATEPQRNRFNKGVSGRGRDMVSPEQVNRIRSLAAYFRGTDFALYGLSGENS